MFIQQSDAGVRQTSSSSSRLGGRRTDAEGRNRLPAGLIGAAVAHRHFSMPALRVLLLAIAAVAWLLPQTATAQPPRVVMSLDDLVLTHDTVTHLVDLRGVYWGAPEECDAESSDESVVTAEVVNGYNLILTVVGPGEATILASASNEYGTVEHDFDVQVLHKPPESVGEIPEQEMRVGDELPLDLSGAFSGEALTYAATSSDESAATVSVAASTATITAHGAGMATITVTASNTGGSAEQTVVVRVLRRKPEAVGELPDLTVTVGDDPVAVDLAPAFSGDDLSYSTVSDREDIATVSSAGTMAMVSPVAAGMATVTATAMNSEGSAEQTFMVTVQDLPPSAADMLPDISLIAGGEPALVDAAAAFNGSALVFAASAAGDAVSVNIAGGHVTVTPLVEGESTVTVTATNTAGQASQSFTASVSTDAEESDALENTVAAIARGTLASINSAIGSRFQAERMGAPASATNGFAPVGAGQMAPGRSGGFGAWTQPGIPFSGALPTRQHGYAGYHAGTNGVNAFGYGPAMRSGGLQQLAGMNFAIPLNAADSGGAAWAPAAEWTLWGHVDRQGFDGDGFDGDLISFYIGADADFGNDWLAGVALSHSSGDADYKFDSAYASGTGDLDTNMVSVIPYVRWSVDDLAEVWAIAGAGWGDVDLSRSATAEESEADLSMWMLSAGGRRVLASGAEWNFALTGDAGILEMQTDGGAGLVDDMNVDVGRVKVAFEGERVISMEDGNRFAIFGQVGGRHDTGDGETGSGVELMGGVRYDSAGRIRVEASARLLGLHSAGGYEENGVSLSAIVRPRADGTGASLALSSYLGAGMSANNASLEQGYGYPGRRLEDFGPESDAWGMDARIGYSLNVRRLSGLMTPFASFDMAGNEGHGMRMGLRYDLASRGSAAMFNLEFTGGQEYDRWLRETNDMVQLRGELRF